MTPSRDTFLTNFVCLADDQSWSEISIGLFFAGQRSTVSQCCWLYVGFRIAWLSMAFIVSVSLPCAVRVCVCSDLPCAVRVCGNLPLYYRRLAYFVNWFFYLASFRLLHLLDVTAACAYGIVGNSSQRVVSVRDVCCDLPRLPCFLTGCVWGGSFWCRCMIGERHALQVMIGELCSLLVANTESILNSFTTCVWTVVLSHLSLSAVWLVSSGGRGLAGV